MSAGRWRQLSAHLVKTVTQDIHVLGTLLFRGWALLAGVLTMVLVPVFLPKEHQGFYFTFSSLISIQIFFELGFNHVIAQIVSHELALHGEALDDAERSRHIARLHSVREMARRWYVPMSAGFALVAFVAGFLFFDNQQALARGEWVGPWAMLCAAGGINLLLSPFLAVAEGAGRVGQVARLRLLQSAAGYVSMWILLSIGADLWAAVAVPCFAAVVSMRWVRIEDNLGLPRMCSEKAALSTNSVRWRTDILPLQWRVAVSWISGFFIFQIFNPFIFANQGPAAAGRTGLALAGYTAILGLGMSWVNARSPLMSSLIAQRRRAELDDVFRGVIRRSLAFTLAATVALVASVALARLLGIGLAERIADPVVLTLMGVTTLTNCAINAMAIYMRCHKEEPMVLNSVVMAVLTLAAVAYGTRVGVTLPFALHAALTLIVALPWTLRLFQRYQNRSLNELGSS